MPMTEKEALASLKILVAVAKADGKLHASERKSLEKVLSGGKLPAGTSVEALLKAKIDIADEVAKIESQEAKEATYAAAYTLANSDLDYSAEEKALLDEVRKGLDLPAARNTFFKRVFGEAQDTLLPSNIKPIADKKKRDAEIKEDVLKYSVISGVLGANPVPVVSIATDMAVVALQFKMVRDIGQYWGQKDGEMAAKSLIAGLGLSAGARIAVTNLVKFVPGWGSVVGASASFASTWALGKIADRWFEAGCPDDFTEFKELYKKAEKDGKSAYKENKSKVEAAQEKHRATLDKLGADLKAGKISQAEYQAAVEKLG